MLATKKAGYLTEAVRRKPYAVLLLDEVEKAHPDVFNVLLQVLDDGRLTDGQGRTVDFKNTVIVMTSNIGSSMIQAMVGEDADDIKDAVTAELKNHFRPEFLNRIDETVVFHALDASHIADIDRASSWPYLTARLAHMEPGLDVSAKRRWPSWPRWDLTRCLARGRSSVRFSSGSKTRSPSCCWKAGMRQKTRSRSTSIRSVRRVSSDLGERGCGPVRRLARQTVRAGCPVPTQQSCAA
jgi:hypothetical protein